MSTDRIQKKACCPQYGVDVGKSANSESVGRLVPVPANRVGANGYHYLLHNKLEGRSSNTPIPNFANALNYVLTVKNCTFLIMVRCILDS